MTFNAMAKKINIDIARAMVVPSHLIKAMADREELVLKGKRISIACGHPEWENTCLSCGEVEIVVGEKECLVCGFKIIGKLMG